MSVRAMAVELYRVMKQIEELEKELGTLPAGSSQRMQVERELKTAHTECDRIKKMLDGAKAL